MICFDIVDDDSVWYSQQCGKVLEISLKIIGQPFCHPQVIVTCEELSAARIFCGTLLRVGAAFCYLRAACVHRSVKYELYNLTEGRVKNPNAIFKI